MPTYEYRCQTCGNELEAVQKFSDPALTECPECGGPLRKVFSAVGVVFKGSGFYATDNRTKGKSNASVSGGGSSDAGGSDSSTSSTTSGDSSASSSTPSSAAPSSRTDSTPAAKPAAPVSTTKPS